jgi:putative hydrolase of the HAD superfamily
MNDQSLAEVLFQYGIEKPQLINEFKIKGMTWDQLLEDYVTEFHKSCVPYPHLTEMLQHLSSKNFSLGLITNAPGDFQFKNI